MAIGPAGPHARIFTIGITSFAETFIEGIHIGRQVEERPVLYDSSRNDIAFDASDGAEIPVRRVARRFMGQADEIIIEVPFIDVALLNGAGKDGVAVIELDDIEAVVDSHLIEIHDSRITHQSLHSRGAVSDRQIITVSRRALCPLIRQPVQIHGQCSRPGECLRRYFLPSPTAVCHIDDAVIGKAGQGAVTGHIPDRAVSKRQVQRPGTAIRNSRPFQCRGGAVRNRRRPVQIGSDLIQINRNGAALCDDIAVNVFFRIGCIDMNDAAIDSPQGCIGAVQRQRTLEENGPIISRCGTRSNIHDDGAFEGNAAAVIGIGTDGTII